MSDDTKFCTACGSPMTAAQSAPAEQPQTQAQPAAQPQATQFDAQPAATAAPAPTPTPIPQPVPVFQTNPRVAPAPAAQATASQTFSDRLPMIGLIIAIVALILAIIGFIMPGGGPGKAQVVDAGTATITITAGENTGKMKILPDNSSYIVVATSVGGDSTFSDVMFNSGTGELVIYSTHPLDADKQRSVNWVAYEKRSS